MKQQLAAMLLNNRLTLSSALSVLLHLLAVFFVSLLLQTKAITPAKPKPDTLEVSFAQAARPHTRTPKPILTTTRPAPFKVAQANNKQPPHPLTPVPVVAQPAPATETIEGVAFPGAIATPFPGQARTGNPFAMQARGAQQEAARAYYQQAMETQARQRADFQAQLMLQQLQQLLAKRLDAEPTASGKCMFVEADDHVNHRLKCDSSALYEVLHDEQKNIAGMLIALRGLGRAITGFTIESRNNNSIISIY
jgi:hypothetical protein